MSSRDVQDQTAETNNDDGLQRGQLEAQLGTWLRLSPWPAFTYISMQWNHAVNQSTTSGKAYAPRNVVALQALLHFFFFATA